MTLEGIFRVQLAAVGAAEGAEQTHKHRRCRGLVPILKEVMQSTTSQGQQRPKAEDGCRDRAPDCLTSKSTESVPMPPVATGTSEWNLSYNCHGFVRIHQRLSEVPQQGWLRGMMTLISLDSLESVAGDRLNWKTLVTSLTPRPQWRSWSRKVEWNSDQSTIRAGCQPPIVVVVPTENNGFSTKHEEFW